MAWLNCQTSPSPPFESWLVDDPAVPFYQSLATHLLPKTALCLSGSVPKRSQRFEINFLIEREDSAPDIAFHFNPRFVGDEHFAAMNSKFDGDWEEELRTWECPSCEGENEDCKMEEFPFKLKKDFWMLIFFTEEEYLVSVDGHHFTSFKHRYPLIEVNAIEVTGDVDLTEVELKRDYHYPPAAIPDNDWKLIIPYSRAFVDPVVPQTSIKIRGKVPKKSSRFRVDLFTDWTDCSDNAFHFNPRFEESSVYCNSFHNNGGGWGEELVFDLTLYRGVDFLLEILVTDCDFIVSVGGAQILTFGHRMSLSYIKRVAISGEVKIRSVDITVPPKYLPCSTVEFPVTRMPPLSAGGMVPPPPHDIMAFGTWIGQRLQGLPPHVAAELRGQIQAMVDQKAAGFAPFPGSALPPQLPPPGQYPQFPPPGQYQPYPPPGQPAGQPPVPPTGGFCGWVPNAPPPN